MGMIKAILIGKLDQADLTQDQEQEVMNLLYSTLTLNDSCLEDTIDWAIMKVKSQASTVTVESIHNENNKQQVSITTLEIENQKLKMALSKVLNFEYGSWKAAQALLDQLNKE